MLSSQPLPACDPCQRTLLPARRHDVTAPMAWPQTRLMAPAAPPLPRLLSPPVVLLVSVGELNMNDSQRTAHIRGTPLLDHHIHPLHPYRRKGSALSDKQDGGLREGLQHGHDPAAAFGVQLLKSLILPCTRWEASAAMGLLQYREVGKQRTHATIRLTTTQQSNLPARVGACLGSYGPISQRNTS